MVSDLVRALTRKRDPEPAVEMLDLETLRSRIGEPLPPKKPEPDPTGYVRSDGRTQDSERSWRRTAGLTR